MFCYIKITVNWVLTPRQIFIRKFVTWLAKVFIYQSNSSMLLIDQTPESKWHSLLSQVCHCCQESKFANSLSTGKSPRGNAMVWQIWPSPCTGKITQESREKEQENQDCRFGHWYRPNKYLDLIEKGQNSVLANGQIMRGHWRSWNPSCILTS